MWPYWVPELVARRCRKFSTSAPILVWPSLLRIVKSLLCPHMACLPNPAPPPHPHSSWTSALHAERMQYSIRVYIRLCIHVCCTAYATAPCAPLLVHANVTRQYLADQHLLTYADLNVTRRSFADQHLLRFGRILRQTCSWDKHAQHLEKNPKQSSNLLKSVSCIQSAMGGGVTLWGGAQLEHPWVRIYALL